MGVDTRSNPKSDLTTDARNDGFRPSDPLGVQRVLEPAKKCMPQQAKRLDASLPIAADELLIEVESLNIDSASFRQIRDECGDDVAKIGAMISGIVGQRGKMQNPVTGSGGMLIGRVRQVGPEFPIDRKPVAVGDRVATLVSLTLTPLVIRKLKSINVKSERVDIEGHAILFASGVFARLPDDLPETVALAVLDVAGAPAQTRRLVKPGNTVLLIGGAGKSGLLCLHEAKKVEDTRVIALDPSPRALQKVEQLGLAHETIQADATDAVAVMNAVWEATKGQMADVVINVANVPETEMASMLSCKPGGVVYFFSMATSFTRAALGAEGVGADIELRIGNGYADGHAEIALQALRDSAALREHFASHYS